MFYIYLFVWLHLFGAVDGRLSLAASGLDKLPTELFKEFTSSKSTGDLSLDTEVDVIVFLQHPNPELIYATLKGVSDPLSPDYGNYLTHEQLSSIVGRIPEELEKIKSFLLKTLRSDSDEDSVTPDLFNISGTKDQVFVRSTIRELNDLFDGKLGYVGEYSLAHRGSDVLIAHRLLTGDESQDDLKSYLPADVSQLVDSIYIYMPVTKYPIGSGSHGSFMSVETNSSFPSFVKSNLLPETVFTQVIKGYDLMNPLKLDVNPEDGARIFVLEGTRGVGTAGVIHFLLTKEDGSVRVEEGKSAVELCGLTEQWKNVVTKDAKHIKAIELLVNQNGISSVLSYPFTEEVIKADCHKACSINGVVDGTCIMYQVKFHMQPYRAASVKARAIFHNGTTTNWEAGAMNPEFFYSNTIVDLSNIEKLYGIEGNPSVRPDERRESIVIGAFLEEQFDPLDVYNYVKAQGSSVKDFDDRLIMVGPNNPNEGRATGIEATLDVEIIMSLAKNSEIIAWTVPGREMSSDREPFLRLMYQLSCWNEEVKELPNILSLSYGDEEVAGIGSYLHRLDREFAKLGILGVTVLSASGDDGANGMKSRGVSPSRCSTSGPGYPPSLPSVTSVGATQLSQSMSPMCHSSIMILPPLGHMECERIGEIAAQTDEGGSLVTTGGGFSYYFDNGDLMGWFQVEAVQAYAEMADELPPSSFYNKQGRGFPDISAIGTNVPILLGGHWALLSGTSVSAPVAAGVVANIGQSIKYRYNKDHHRLGFLSPVLYKLNELLTSVYEDIVVGRNSCGYKETQCCPYGFDATVGWDPLSGLGSIKVNAFAEAYTQLIVLSDDDSRPKAAIVIEAVEEETTPPFYVIDR